MRHGGFDNTTSDEDPGAGLIADGAIAGLLGGIGKAVGDDPDGGPAWMIRAPELHQRFKGLGPVDDAKGTETLDLLSKLATMMVEVGRNQLGTEWFNLRTPAGYTYFGQFLAHDLISSVPQSDHPQAPTRNYRKRPLRLDAIYGDGPDTAPWFYERPKMGDPRVRLRLGMTVPSEQSGNPEPGWDDIPRIRSLQAGSRSPKSFDPLIADQRNDDNLILSQLVATLHKCHNKIFDRLSPGSGDGTFKRWSDQRSAFALARKLLIHVYQNIIVEDYLQHILPGAIYESHRSAYREAIRSETAGARASKAIPIEFYMAAFRFGHVTVATNYRLNDRLRASLRQVLDFTSQDEDTTSLPLTPEWVISWEQFFDLTPDGTGKPHPSRRIRPAVVDAMHTHASVRASDDKGGVVYRTLARGFRAGLWNGQHLARALDKTVLKPDAIAALLKEYCAHAKVPELFTLRELSILASDTPLFFYIIAEAAMNEAGERLGSLGGEIVATVIFQQLTAAHEQLSTEEDALLRKAFDPAVPRSIAELIAFSGHGASQH